MELYPTCIDGLKTVQTNFKFGRNLDSSDYLSTDDETIPFMMRKIMNWKDHSIRLNFRQKTSAKP